MEKSIYRISLDMNTHVSQAVLLAKVGDTGRQVRISLSASGVPYEIADRCRAFLAATKPGGNILDNACTIEGNEIVYEFTEQTCSEVGRTRCEVKLYGADGSLITSPRFTLLVADTVYSDSEVESTDEFTGLTQMIREVNVATEAAEKVAKDLETAMDNGEFKGEKGEKGEKGDTGQDGVSCTHSWNGTSLTVTSASGTSSADLKGEQGEPGTALIDDSTVGTAAWSSKNIVDKLCPSFNKKGTLVQCEPVVEGYPLDVHVKSDGESSVIQLTICGKNLYDRNTYDLNTVGYIYEANGNVSGSSNYRHTDYIPVSHLQGQTINLNNAPVDSSYPGMAFYDENKKYISGGKGNAITVPQNARYMRFSVHVDHLENVQIELGSKATDYEAYSASKKIVFDDNSEEYLSVDGISGTAGKMTLFAYAGFYEYDKEVFTPVRVTEVIVSGRADPIAVIENLQNEIDDIKKTIVAIGSIT